jgi:hypothetical protein
VAGTAPSGVTRSSAALLEQAAAARAAGDVEAVAVALTTAFAAAQAEGDTVAMAAAALALPSAQRFGVHPGQFPVLLHAAHTAAVDPATRCRLAAALARSWVYGGDAIRGRGFADEALALGAELGTPDVLAEALDAALVTRWGPDDFVERVGLAARLDDNAAHLADPELRLSAYLWRLTTAWECLDIVSVHRQLRALDVLAADSGSLRVAFFAVSRRAMYALTTGDHDLADELIPRTARLGDRAGEPDAEAVLHSLVSTRARYAADVPRLRAEAAAYDEFAAAEGIPSIAAEAAVLWQESGDVERAGVLVEQLLAGGFDGISRDVDFLLTTTSIVGVAARLGLPDIARAGSAVLAPYAGRGVLNAGAVSFHGVVDDYLYRAGRAVGDADSSRWRHRAATAYQRLGVLWWEERLASGDVPRPPSRPRVIHLHHGSEDGWVIGAAGATTVLPNSKGLEYLRYLVQRPGVDVPAIDLSDAAAGHPTVRAPTTDLGPLIDRNALAAYRRRLREIAADLDEADAMADPARSARLQAERDALLHQVRSATGLRGRTRSIGSSEERARVAVRKAITAILDRIETRDPALARLLRDSIRTGAACRYDPRPDEPITWITDCTQLSAPPP